MGTLEVLHCLFDTILPSEVKLHNYESFSLQNRDQVQEGRSVKPLLVYLVPAG